VADVAGRAALAVETARLFEREHKVAVTLQHSLLPARLPDVPGVERAVRYVAGRLEQEVGGDWYDAVCSPDGRVAFTIGDVVGHDVTAASVMGQLRNAVRVYASEGHEPGAVVSRLNRLVDSLGLDHMATMVHAVLNPVTGELRYTNAGHPLPLLLRADGTTEWLQGPGSLPVGAIPEPMWAEASAELAHGDTIVLYTDGLVEDRRRPIDDGLADLRAAVAAAAGRDADGLCDYVLDELLTGEARGDDVALLVFRWTG
jgi:serine phosphatase RsbU (regulator of sigma subunit)